MTFNELLELDKEAAGTSKVPEKPDVESGPIPFPAPDKPKSKPKKKLPPIKRDTTIPRHHGITTPSMVKGIRKAVRQIGKEAATHRFTQEEKNAIAQIVFSYGQQGFKTCENEITRIGINWLLEDYQANRKGSMLHKVLAALQA